MSCPAVTRSRLMALQEREAEFVEERGEEMFLVKQEIQKAIRGGGSIFENAEPELFVEREEM